MHDLDFFDEMMVDIDVPKAFGSVPAIKLIGMPGKHVPPGPGGLMGKANDLLAAVPPTNGWMMELGHKSESDPGDNSSFRCGYRIYISGDTLLVPELEEIPKRFPHVDLMLVHLGGTTIPRSVSSFSVSLIMIDAFLHF